MSDDNTSKDNFKDFLRSIACGNPRCKELEAKLAEAKADIDWLIDNGRTKSHKPLRSWKDRVAKIKGQGWDS